MKTLTLAFLIAAYSFSFSQNNSDKANTITFNVELEDDVNILKWESNKEVNTSYYLIERSLNGKDFEILDTQKAGSSTYTSTAYSFEYIEGNPSATYRITLVMMDGSILSTLASQTQNENFANTANE